MIAKPLTCQYISVASVLIYFYHHMKTKPAIDPFEAHIEFEASKEALENHLKHLEAINLISGVYV